MLYQITAHLSVRKWGYDFAPVRKTAGPRTHELGGTYSKILASSRFGVPGRELGEGGKERRERERRGGDKILW